MNTEATPPEPSAPRSEWARFYCGSQLALVYIPPGSKAPKHTGWNRPGGYITDPTKAEAFWRKNPRHNLGAVLGPSRMVTFDGDQLEWSRKALAAVGLSLDEFLAVGAAIEGNPKKAKRVFRVPAECDLGLRKLLWPDPDDPDDAVTVFELRAGPVQDVLPPSLHPDTRQPYRWVEGRAPWDLGGLPPLPDWLLRFWRQWDERLPLMEAACPWRPALAARPQPQRRDGASDAEGWDAVREELLQRIDLDAVLEGMGAQRRGSRSYLCPFHEERSPSFWVFDSGRGHFRWVCAHGAAPVGRRTAKGWSCGDALDLIAHQKGLPVGKATVELARQMDVPLPKGPQESKEPGLPEPPPDRTRPACEGVAPGPAEAREEEEEPLPLPIHRVEPFPVEALPGPLQRMVLEVAQALPCPADFVGVPMLAVAGAAIGTSRVIQVKQGWREGARLYSGVVAEPGSKKSPALDHVIQPLMRRQLALKAEYDGAKERHLQEVGRYERELAAWKEAVRKEAKDGGGNPGEMPLKPEEPVMGQLIASDATLEAVAQLLAENPRGLLFFRDELTGWVRAMDAYRSGKGADRQAWLTFWSGGSYIVNRKSEKEPLVLTNPFVCVTGCLPPDVLGELSDERGREDGFIHRVLFAYPDPVPLSWSEAVISDATLQGYDAVVQALWGLKPGEDEEGRRVPQVLSFTPDAKALWVEWIEDHYREGADPLFPPNLRGPWAKLEGYCARLALVLHLCRYVCCEAESEEVDRISVAGAATLVEYFKSHARRVYARLHATEDDQRVVLALTWIQKRGGTATARDLLRSNVAGVKTADDAQRLLRTLERRGYGKTKQGAKKSLSITLTTAPDTRQMG